MSRWANSGSSLAVARAVVVVRVESQVRPPKQLAVKLPTSLNGFFKGCSPGVKIVEGRAKSTSAGEIRCASGGAYPGPGWVGNVRCGEKPARELAARDVLIGTSSAVRGLAGHPLDEPR